MDDSRRRPTPPIRPQTPTESAAVIVARMVVQMWLEGQSGHVVTTPHDVVCAIANLAEASGERGRDVWALSRPSYAERDRERRRLVELMSEELFR